MSTFGTPIGKRAHGRRDDRGAARTAGADDAGDVALALDPGLERFGHRGDRGAALAAEHGRAAAAMIERDFLRRHVAGRELAARRDVDEARAQAARDDEVADEAQLRSLGVERADDEDHRRPGRPRRRRVRSAAASIRAGPTEAMRALDSIRAFGDRLRPPRRRRRVGDIDPDRRRGSASPRLAGRGADSRAASVARSGSASEWRPTPRSRCCSSRSAASLRDSMMRLIRPLTMMATFSETVVATPMFCSMTRIAMSLSSPRRTSISSTCATMTGARPSVGSSMMRRRGLVTSAREIASICCSPPESCAPLLLLRSARRGKAS